MKILFVKDRQNWPRSSGHDVHGFFMMKALSSRGHQIGLLTEHEPSALAVEGLELVYKATFSETIPTRPKSIRFFQRKFGSYWGVDETTASRVAAVVESQRFDAVVVVGLRVLPYLSQLKDVKRIWYAADEWFLHHYSLIRWKQFRTWAELKHGVIKGLYERVFSSCTDIVWVVSERDAWFMTRLMPHSKVAIVPNGVDTGYYSPVEDVSRRNGVVFWGRLDFQPNIDSIEWFGNSVWRLLKDKHPDCEWSVLGFSVSKQVLELQQRFQFHLETDLPDIRRRVANYSVAVMPFVTGAGVKNKLLEAASMGMKIVSSPMGVNGLVNLPAGVAICCTPHDWISKIEQFWSEQNPIDLTNREWTRCQYSWDSSGLLAENSILNSQKPIQTPTS